MIGVNRSSASRLAKTSLIALALTLSCQLNAAPIATVTARVRAVLQDKLLDYNSARFRDVRIAHLSDKSGYVVCGDVNSKNAYGAYIGWHKFNMIGDLGPKTTALMIGSNLPESVIIETCAKIKDPWTPINVAFDGK